MTKLRKSRVCLFIAWTLIVLGVTGIASAQNTHSIEGYAKPQSVGPGETVNFCIHLPAGRTAYTVEIYRWGSTFVGANAIGKKILGPLAGTNGQVQNYGATTHIDGAGWNTLFSLTIPSSTTLGAHSFPPLAPRSIAKATWRSGIYTAKIIDTVSTEFFHITFVVKDGPTTRKPIALLASTNTWAAYNFWPDMTLAASHSIYGGPLYDPDHGVFDQAPSVKVTFHRPNPYATPEVKDILTIPGRPYLRTEHLVAGELRVARWLEVNKKAYSMLTDWDVDTIANVLDPAVFKTVIISTHSEYWTPGMYNAVTDYLNKGGNVISLSGNTCYWKATLDATGLNRTIQKDVNWTPQEQASLLGLASYGASGVGYITSSGFAHSDVTPYYLRRSSHWAFASIPGVPFVGSASVLSYRSFATDGTRGASGWEVDRTDPANKVFAREFSDLAESINHAQHSHIAYIRRASAGQVFSVGSVLAGQSLMVDAPFSKTMLSVLSRFSKNSFSDFNGDGKPDLIARKFDGTVWRYLGDGAGSFTGGGTQLALASWALMDQVMSPGDIDSDGISDIVTRSTDGKLWLFKGTGLGTLKPAVLISTSWNAYNMFITPGDFDHDGRPDLIVRRVDDNSLRLCKGDGKGKFIVPSTSFNSGWGVFDFVVGTGDLDEDGNPDFVAHRSADGNLLSYAGDGFGNLALGSDQGSIGAWLELFSAGDFDHVADGSGLYHADFMGRTSDGKLWLYPGGGNGTFAPKVQIDDAGWDLFSHVVGVW